MKKILVIIAIVIASAVSASAQVKDSAIRNGKKYKDLKYLYDYTDYTRLSGDRYNPTVSGVLSFIIPGLGQGINNEIKRGFAWFGGAAGSYLVAGIGIGCLQAGVDSENGIATGTGAVLTTIGMLSGLTIEICSIVDAVRVAKVKNMYEQDLRGKLSFDLDLHPSVDYIQTANGVQPTAGLTLALNF